MFDRYILKTVRDIVSLIGKDQIIDNSFNQNERKEVNIFFNVYKVRTIQNLSVTLKPTHSRYGLKSDLKY